MNPFQKSDQSEPAQATYVQPTVSNSLETQTLDSSLESTNAEANLLAKQEKDEAVAHASERFEQIERLERNHRFVRYAMIVALLLSVGAVVFLKLHSTPQKATLSSVNQKYSTQKINLDKLSTDKNPVDGTSSNSVDVNGQLHVNNSLILTPAPEPSSAVAGQLYYDADTSELKFYNGESFNTLTTSNNVVISLGGSSGPIDLGSGLALFDNQLVNTGVQSISAGANISIDDDGAGNLTISSAASGSVGSPNGTTGRIAKFLDAQTIADSLLSESGSTVTVNGSLNVTGNLTLSTALTVSQGGTGLSTLSANQLLFASSANSVAQLSNGTAGQCLTSNGPGSAPSFQNCAGGGGGVTSLNGQNGLVTLVNATGGSGTITIDDAAADDATKGIASFSSSNFAASSGNISIKTGGVTSTEIANGTITNTDLATGTFANITGVGTLNAGSITTGFGTIATTNTITGSVVNGTTSIRTGAGAGITRIDTSGNLTNIGTITASGLITGSNGLTIGAGTVTLSGLTGGASTCLTLNASSQVGAASCATGSGSTPTLQNVYDNSGATPSILLASLGKGISIQDAGVSVGGNLLAVKNSTGAITYLGVTTTGTSINGNISATGTVTFSSLGTGVAVLTSGVLTSSTINLGALPAYISGTLPVGNGGTGASSFGSTNGVIYYDGTKLAASNAGTTGQCLLANTGSAPSFGTCTGAGGVSSVTATTTQTGALVFNGTPNQVSVTNSGTTFTFATPQSIATSSDVQFNSVNATSLLKTNGTTRIDASGNLSNIGTISASGLITGSNGLTISAGAVTLNNLTGGSSTCLTLDVSNQVGTATCATGSGSTPTLQNVYDNSSTTPNILLSSTGKGVTIQDAATTVGGNLLAVKNNAGTITYLGVTTTGASITGSLSVSSNVTLSSLSGGAAANQCLTTDATGQLQLVSCLSGGSGGSGGVSSLNGLSGAITIDNASVSLQHIIINNAAADGTTKGIASFSASNFAASSGNITIKTGGVTTTEILDGTIVNADLAGGTYSSITGTGALSAGSIVSGFGTIATANTITGTTINGTTGINTGAGAGTQRIDASGNLVNIGTINTSGTASVASLTVKAGGNLTLNNLTPGANQCLVLYTNVVGVDNCPTAPTVPTPTLQNVYDASNPANITLNGTNGGLVIQDAGTSVGTLFTISNSGNTTQYLTVSPSGLSAAGTITLSSLSTGVVKSNGSGVLSSGTIDLGNSSYVTGTVGVGNGGTGLATLTANGLLYASASSTIGQIANGNTGECLIANTGAAPAFQSCGGSGIGTSGPTTANKLTKFGAGASSITDSQIADDGTHVSVGGSGTTGGLFNVGASDQFQVSSAGAITAVGLNSGAGLIQGSGGLTVSGGNITLSSLSSNASTTCLVLDGSNQVHTSTCAAGSGSGNYIQNQNSAAQSANFFIQGTASSVTAVIQGATGGTNITDFKSSGGTTVASIDASGHFAYVASGTAGATLVCQNASSQLAPCSNSYQTTLTFANGITNSSGTVGLGGTLTSATTLAAGNANNISITSDLSGGNRGTSALTISQANDATNKSNTALVSFTNNDTDSTTSAPVLSISQVNGGTAVVISGSANSVGINLQNTNSGSGVYVPSLTTGSGFRVDGGTGLTSGNAFTVSSVAASGALSAFTGTYFNAIPTRTNTATSGTLTDTGNFLNLTRSNTQNGAGGTYAITGAVANIQSNCTQTAGTCTDSSNILNLNQQYANATGALLNASNSGGGAAINITQSHTLGSNAAIQLNYTGGTGSDILLSLQNSGTPKFTIDANGNTTAVGTYNTNTFTGNTLTFGSGSSATVSSNGANALNVDAGGAAALNLGTTNANAVSISRTGVTTTINGGLTVTQLLTANAGLTISAGSTFTNASSTLNSVIALGNLASGPIGTNSATVDISTAFTINPSASGRSYTLPTPTNTAAGRVIYISNINGSFSFDIAGVTVPAGANAGFMWNGSAWAASNVSTGASVVGSLNGGTANANGATISGNTIYLQSASASFAGLVDTANGQVFAGTKFFSSLLTANAGLTASGGAISLTGNAASSLTTTVGNLTLDSAATVNIGVTNATNVTVGRTGQTITLNGDTTSNGNIIVASGKYVTITGSATRPVSPTEGMLYYDTTTKQLLVYSTASGTAKWQADRHEAILVAASDSSTADKDAADYVADGNTVAANDGDQIQIQAALDDADPAGSGRKTGKVYLFAGTYTLDAAMTIKNNVTLAGVGRATLITVPTLNSSINVISNFDTSTGTGVVIQDLRLDGNKGGQSSGTLTGIRFSGMGSGSGSGARQGGKLTNLWVNNWGSAGISLSSSANNTITGNIAIGNDMGISLSSSANNTITGNATQGGTSHGIFLINSDNNTVSSNTSQGNAGEGIMLNSSNGVTITGNTTQGNDVGVYLASASNNTVSGNTSQGNTRYGIYLSGSTYNTLTGNTAQGNTLDGITLTSSAANNLITGNTSQGNSGNGIFVGTSCDGNTITGNKVQGNTSNGIYLSSADNNNVTGNTVQSNTAFGIYLNTSNTNVISSNRAIDNGGATTNNGIYLATAATNTITGNSITDSSATTNNYAININSGASNYLSNNTLGTGSVNNGVITTIFGGQVDSSTNYVVQPAGAISLNSNVNIAAGKNLNLAAGAGNISLSGYSGTGSALSITATANPAAGSALIFANNTAGSPSGNLIDVQAGSSSKFAVDVTGKVTLVGGQAIDITTSGATSLKLDTGGAAGVTIGGTNATSVTIGRAGQAGGINVGVSTVSNTINIGNATITAGNTQTINIGTSSTSTGNDIITIGSLNDGSTTTLQAGTGGIVNSLASNTSNAFVLQNNTQSLSSTGQFMTFSAATSASNLLTNPSFEDNPITTWAADGTASAPTRDTTQSYNGAASGKVITGTAAGNGIKQNLSALSGTYTVSFYAKLDAASAAFSTMVFGLYNGTNETTYASAAQTVVTGGWTRYSATFAGVSTTGTPYFYAKQTDTTTHTFYIDQVQVEASSNASGLGIGTAQINSVVVSPLTLQNTVNSTNAFGIYDASGNIVFGVDTLNRRVVFGSGVTSAHSKYITLTPEYVGAVLDAAGDASCSGANNGTMTSAFDSGGTKQNYYQWVSGAAATNCYDVVVAVPIPADFLSWGAGPTIYAASSTSLANSICLQILNTTGSADTAYASYSCQTPGTTIAALTTFATPTSSYTATAGNTITLKIRMSSNTTSSLTKLGNISIPYTSSY